MECHIPTKMVIVMAATHTIIPRNIWMVVKMNMANPILRWLLLKLRVPSFVVYETAIEKRAMTRTKAPVLTFLWRLNQSGPFGKRSLNSDDRHGKSTPHAMKANTSCASHTFIFGTFTSSWRSGDECRIAVVGVKVESVVIAKVGVVVWLAVVETWIAVVGVEVESVAIAEVGAVVWLAVVEVELGIAVIAIAIVGLDVWAVVGLQR
jgi:hypothetical protein